MKRFMSYAADDVPGLLECLNHWQRVCATLDEAEAVWLAPDISRYRCSLRALLDEREGQDGPEAPDRVWLEVLHRQDDDGEDGGREIVDDTYEPEPLNVGAPLDPAAAVVVSRDGLRIHVHGEERERIAFELGGDEYIDPDGKRQQLTPRQPTLHRIPPTHRRRVEADVRALARWMRRKRSAARERDPWWAAHIRPTDPAPSERAAAIARRCAQDWRRFGSKVRRCQSPRCVEADGAPCWFDGSTSTSATRCPACRRRRSRATHKRDLDRRRRLEDQGRHESKRERGGGAPELIEAADRLRSQG